MVSNNQNLKTFGTNLSPYYLGQGNNHTKSHKLVQFLPKPSSPELSFSRMMQTFYSKRSPMDEREFFINQYDLTLDLSTTSNVDITFNTAQVTRSLSSASSQHIQLSYPRLKTPFLSRQHVSVILSLQTACNAPTLHFNKVFKLQKPSTIQSISKIAHHQNLPFSATSSYPSVSLTLYLPPQY